jgi:hypothetical protein
MLLDSVVAPPMLSALARFSSSRNSTVSRDLL